jgi:nucleoside phosphorylase
LPQSDKHNRDAGEHETGRLGNDGGAGGGALAEVGLEEGGVGEVHAVVIVEVAVGPEHVISAAKAAREDRNVGAIDKTVAIGVAGSERREQRHFTSCVKLRQVPGIRAVILLRQLDDVLCSKSPTGPNRV